MKAVGFGVAALLSGALGVGASVAQAGEVPAGRYLCDDRGTLELSLGREPGFRYASLEYEDGSASTIAAFEFTPGESEGLMVRDDDDGRVAGRFSWSEQESELNLIFGDGSTIACGPATSSGQAEPETLLHNAKAHVGVGVGGGYYAPPRPPGYYSPPPPFYAPPPRVYVPPPIYRPYPPAPPYYRPAPPPWRPPGHYPYRPW